MKFFEPAMVVLGVVGPMAALPQVIKLWFTHSHHAHGQSLLTWGMYAVLSIVWLAYGLYVNRPPLYLGQAVQLTLNMLMVIGIVIHAGLTY